MSTELIIHNVGFISGAVIAIVPAIFVYLRGRTQTANIMWSLGSLCVAIFCVSHVIGVNVRDPVLSRDILMFNMVNVFLTSFMAHCVFAVIGEVKKQRLFIIGMYTVSITLALIYIIFPDTFLLPSHPKMYFPNYYVAGRLDWVMRVIFNGIIAPYFIIRTIIAYRRADPVMQNRLRYFFASYILGYSLGSLAIPLIYDIQIDPVLSAFFVPFYVIPIAYAILKYNLMDIRVLTKRALLFAVVIACASFAIFMVGFVNSLLSASNPNFPQWIIPLFAGCAATLLGYLVWKKVRESDLLKYEFVTIVTHKLRTPLTSIKWSAEELVPMVPAEGKNSLEHIKSGTDRLVELTNILGDVSSEDQGKYIYKYEMLDLAHLCRDTVQEYTSLAAEKAIKFDYEAIPLEPVYVQGDAERLRIVIQTLLDNALTYTPKHGHVSISAGQSGSSAIVTVADSGIGMSKDEAHLIFSRLYRTDSARKADTEGMGLGLFLVGRIMERHHGHIKVTSEGPNKGSIFTVTLPVHKSK